MEGRSVTGSRLRELREQAGLRQTQLAAAIGCSAGHLRNMETAKTKKGQERNQPSAALVHMILRELSARLGRPVALDEISDPTPSDAAPAEQEPPQITEAAA